MKIILILQSVFRSSRPEVFCKKGVLRNVSNFKRKHLCQGLFIKKESLVQVFSREFCKVFKNIFFHRTSPVAAFVYVWFFIPPTRYFIHLFFKPLCIISVYVLYLICLSLNISMVWRIKKKHLNGNVQASKN